MLRWDLPVDLLSFTLRLSASPIGFIFNNIDGVTAPDSAAFPHDTRKLHARPQELRRNKVAQCEINATEYAHARTIVYAAGGLGANALWRSKYHCYLPHAEGQWDRVFDLQRAYASTLVDGAEDCQPHAEPSRCSCNSHPGHHGGLYNQVHLEWQTLQHVRAIFYVNATGVKQAALPPDGEPMRARNRGHEYRIESKHAVRSYEAALRLSRALSQFECRGRNASAWTAELRKPVASKALYDACIAPCPVGGRPRVIPVLQLVTRHPQGWCDEAHALKERLRAGKQGVSRRRRRAVW